MSKVAMILAAGRGERMRPLTDATPKPLLRVGNKRLIEYQIERLKAIGCERVVVNQGWLGGQLPRVLGNGDRYGVEISYSDETEFPAALETAGGIAYAIELLGDEFYVVNGDVYCNADLAQLALAEGDVACIQLVKNPPHNSQGDFSLSGNRVVTRGRAAMTFSGEGLYRREMFAQLFANEGVQPYPLKPLLDAAIERGSLAGIEHTGEWLDVGTPQRLQELDQYLRQR